MKRYFIIIISCFFTCFLLQAQDVNVPHLTVFNIRPSTSSLLQKSKWRVIEYKGSDYTVAGFIYKKELLVGQNIILISKSLNDTIICGRYFVENGKSFVDGYWKTSDNIGPTYSVGLFQIQNTDTGLFTIKPRDGGALNIITVDVYDYYGHRKTNPARLQKKFDIKDLYTLSINFIANSDEENDLRKLVSDIEKRVVIEKGFYDITALFASIKHATLLYYNGKVFTGNIKAIIDGADINLFLQDGEATYTKGFLDKEVLKPYHAGLYEYTLYYSNRSKNKAFSSMTIKFPFDLIEKYGYWATASYLLDTPNVEYVYKNGNVYVGKQLCTIDTTGGQNITHCRLTEGVLKYKSGEKFIGNIGGKWVYGVPIEGEMLFTDGTSAKGNWFSQYNCSSEEWQQVSNASSPTQKRDLILAFELAHEYNRKYKNAMSNAELSRNAWNYEVALKYYEIAKDNTNNDALKIAEVDKRIQEINKTIKTEQRNKTIRRLGAIDLGLSVIWSSKNVGATAPHKIGGYFAWGELNQKDDYSWMTYAHAKGSSETIKYIGSNISGTEYDVATQRLGNGFRMPTKREFDELVEKCSFAFVKLHGVKGLLVTGPNGNAIFLPYTNNSTVGDIDDMFKGKYSGNYWTSTDNSSWLFKGSGAYYFSFNSDGYKVDVSYNRYRGFNIRPVLDIE